MNLLLLVGCLVLVYAPKNSEAKFVKILLERKVRELPVSTNRRTLYEKSFVEDSKLSTKTHLSNINNVYYIGWLNVGCPPQKFLVVFDTGSAPLWILSSKICPNDKKYCKSHRTFNNKRSQTYQKDGRDFSIKYVKGAVSGFIGRDDISVAGLKIEDQLLGEATEIAEFQKKFEYEGVFGLSFPLNVTIASEPPFINMIKQKVVDEPVFAFYLSKTKRKSELCFGGVDPDHYTGDFVFTPVISKKGWFFKIDQITFGDQRLVGKYPGLPDTGTALIVGPPDLIGPINKAIGKPDPDVTGLYFVDCDNIETFPTVTFMINNVKFPLLPDEYVKQVAEDDGSVTCVSVFLEVERLDVLILGDVFMRKYYVQFNVGKRQIGFALAKP